MDPPAEEIPLVRTSVGATERPSNTAVFTIRGSDNRDAIERGLDRAAVLARTTAESVRTVVRTVAFPPPPTVEVPCVYLQEKSETPPNISVFTTPITNTA